MRQSSAVALFGVMILLPSGDAHALGEENRGGRISPENPALVVFGINRRLRLQEPKVYPQFDGRHSPAHRAANIVNGMITHLAFASTRLPNVRDYFHFAALGWAGIPEKGKHGERRSERPRVGSVLQYDEGTPSKPVPISALVKDVKFETNNEDLSRGVFVAVKGQGAESFAAQGRGIYDIGRMVSKWIKEHPHGVPPTVVLIGPPAEGKVGSGVKRITAKLRDIYGLPEAFGLKISEKDGGHLAMVGLKKLSTELGPVQVIEIDPTRTRDQLWVLSEVLGGMIGKLDVLSP